MRKGVSMAAGLALMAALSWSAAPARAVPISAPAALKGISDSYRLTETISCWDCGYYGPPRYYHRPYYRSYYRPHYRSYYRPYYRTYSYYRPYGYYRPPVYYRPYYSYYERPYVPPPWVSGPYYPGPRLYHVGPWVFGY